MAQAPKHPSQEHITLPRLIITPRPIITIKLSIITRWASMKTQSIMQRRRTNTVNLRTNIRRPHIHILINNDRT